MKIGVMDSGIGGLNVLAALIKKRCGDKYVYLSDGKNLPYGERSGEELRAIALTGARALAEKGANVIVFGCNTLSTSALDYVKKRVTQPVFGLTPRPDLLCGKALLMTTPATALFLPKIPKNVSILTPRKLASILDRDYPETTRAEEYLCPLVVPYGDCEEVYLGCSHYLFAKKVLGKLLPHAKTMDGVENLAALVRAVLPETGCKNPSIELLFTGEKQTERYLGILSALLK